MKRQSPKRNQPAQNLRKIDRMDLYAEYKNLNDNQITKDCGLSVGTIGKSRKKGKDISRRTAEALLDRYEDLNRQWLLSGEGNMINTPEADGIDFQSFPIVDTAKAECGRPNGLSEAFKEDGLPRIAIPGIPSNTEFFIVATGYSMINYDYPELSIPPGALVGLVKNSGDFMRWGEVYALATADGIMIKRIVPDPEDRESVRCISYNDEEYPAFSIRRDEIYDLARLTCVVPVYVR